MKDTITTGDLNKRLDPEGGISLTPEFIKNTLDVQPSGEARGRPRWSDSDYEEVVDALSEHIRGRRHCRTPAAGQPAPSTGRKPGSGKKATAAAPAAPADDDDEL